MKFEMVRELDEEKFHRLSLTGIKRKTFDRMVEILNQARNNRKMNKGRKKKLGIEDIMNLASLERSQGS